MLVILFTQGLKAWLQLGLKDEPRFLCGSEGGYHLVVGALSPFGFAENYLNVSQLCIVII